MHSRRECEIDKSPQRSRHAAAVNCLWQDRFVHGQQEAFSSEVTDVAQRKRRHCLAMSRSKTRLHPDQASIALTSSNLSLTHRRENDAQVHATLGVRPPAGREGLGSDSQGRMDHQTKSGRKVLTLGKSAGVVGNARRISFPFPAHRPTASSTSGNLSLTFRRENDAQVHATLGVRPRAGGEGLGSDSQGRMDHQTKSGRRWLTCRQDRRFDRSLGRRPIGRPYPKVASSSPGNLTDLAFVGGARPLDPRAMSITGSGDRLGGHA